jgi:hypothetical protein
MTLHGQNTYIGVHKFWPDRQALSGGTVNASSITGLSGLKAGHYRMGYMVLLDGNQKEEVYQIVDNTATSITVNRPDLTASGKAVTNSDTAALFPYKGCPDIDPIWVLVDSFPGFTPTEEWEELHAQRDGGYSYRLDSYLAKEMMEGVTLELTVQDAEMFPFIFPYVTDTADTEASSPLSQTFSTASAPGEDRVVPAAYTNYVQNRYYRFGSASDGEIRQVTNADPSSDGYLQLDKPLRRSHDAGDAIVMMENAAGTYYTHTFKMLYDNLYRMWPLVIKQSYNQPDAQNNFLLIGWFQVKSFTFRNDGNKLKLSISLTGFNFSHQYGYVTGSHDGGNNESGLTDSSADFVQQGVRVGQTVSNVTDGSTGTITAVTKTTVTASLSGGTDDDWDDDDVYTIDVSDAPTAATGNVLVYAKSTVSVNGAEDGKVTTVNVTGDYGTKGQWYHNDDEDYLPSECTVERATKSGELGVRIESDKFLDLLRGGSKFDAYAQYNWDTTPNEYVKIDMKNNRPESVPHDLPPGGPIKSTFKINPQYVEVTVVDDTPYY